MARFSGRGTYSRDLMLRDLVAACIVTIMLIPQSLAYAMLAGLSPEVGLYASMVPLLIYGLTGTSSTLAVGPVAVLSMMTASAIASVGETLNLSPGGVAVWLAALSGAWLLLLGALRLGFIAHFLSHSVIKGFITASGILIALSQARHLLGIDAQGHNALQLVAGIGAAITETHALTAAIGMGCVLFFLGTRRFGKVALRALGAGDFVAELMVKAAPALAVAVTLLMSVIMGMASRGVAVVGAVPAGLPDLAVPVPSLPLLEALAIPALMIALVGYVESISVAQTFAAKRKETVFPNRELLALGAANIGAAVSGGMPVTGGFSRSAVSFDAGAQTRWAGVFTAFGMAAMTLLLAPSLSALPKATLAATIVVAVLALVDLKAIVETTRYSRQDGAATIITIAVTLLAGVELGILVGVGLSLALHLYRTSVPHMAVVGLVPGTEHFRNVQRHEVQTDPRVLCVRVDESLYFANAEFLVAQITRLVKAAPLTEHVVLQCSAVNDIDASALHALALINHRLDVLGIRFHLSEVKGPVMDRLHKVDFLERLSGDVFLSQYAAYQALSHTGRMSTPVDQSAAGP